MRGLREWVWLRFCGRYIVLNGSVGWLEASWEAINGVDTTPFEICTSVPNDQERVESRMLIRDALNG
jgi:hypothetical protein